jgi:hypothetical protein
MAPCAIKKHRGRNHRCGRSSGLPCAMVLRLIRDLLGDRAFLPPSLVDHPTSLAPASGRQNHTISPSAIASFVRAMIAPELLRPSHPASNVRDDRETPLKWERDGDGYKFDLGSSRSDLFSCEWLDMFSQKRRDLPVMQSHKTSHGKSCMAFANSSGRTAR